jgi:hypothetical protein
VVEQETENLLVSGSIPLLGKMEYRQAVRQWILDPSYVGSIPTTPRLLGACNSMVEYSLDKREVGSSNLLRLNIVMYCKHIVMLMNNLTRESLIITFKIPNRLGYNEYFILSCGFAKF